MLSDDTKIYRIFNLHDLINTISTNTIRLCQAANMDDSNELFGIYFDLMRSSFSMVTCVEDLDKQRGDFRKAQSHHYMTCWTQTHDNIAVWSLYSPNRDAVQVCTTYGQLRKAITEHARANSLGLSYSLEPNDPRDLYFEPQIGPVKYINFAEEFNSIKTQTQQYFEEQDAFYNSKAEQRKNADLKGDFDHITADVEEWMKKDDAVRRSIFGKLEHSGALLKDNRYKHEEEVRFVASLYRRDGRTEDEYKAHPMAGLDHPARHPTPDSCPANVFFPFSSDNIIEFAVDGRIDDWKFEAINHFLSPLGRSVVKSRSFQEIEI